MRREAFDALKPPTDRLAGPDAPAASSWVLEQTGVPQPEAVARAVHSMLSLAALP